VQKFIEWYVQLAYERCEQVLAPSRYMCDYLHSIGVMHATLQPLGVDVDTFRRRRDARPAQPSSACRATRACWCSPAVLRREEHPGAARGIPRLGDPITCC
jgi:hypothetical protein